MTGSSKSPGSSTYSPGIQLAFSWLRWFFLSLLGFVMACIASASLKAVLVVETLLQVGIQCFIPLVVFTFCLISGMVVLESFK